MAAGNCDVALREALEKDLGTRRLPIEKRRGGSEQQNMAVARLRAHSLLGLPQKSARALRIGKRSEQDALPSGRAILRIIVRQLLRLIGEGKHRLRRRTTRHARPSGFPQAKPANRSVERMELIGADWAFNSGVASSRGCGQRPAEA